jgi:hypothetical protein
MKFEDLLAGNVLAGMEGDLKVELQSYFNLYALSFGYE